MFTQIIIKPTLLLFLIVSCFSSLAQPISFEEVDQYAAEYDNEFVDIATLARQLTEPFETDLEKARSIFMWLAHHVNYDCHKYHNRKRPYFEGRTQEEVDKKIAEYREKQVIKAAKSQRGICEDYSRLFKALCDEGGLEAALIVGNARDFHKPYRKAHDNPHAWNAIRIDGQWYLLDATWAAGYTNGEVTKFKRKIAPGFFMTPPEWFAQTHYPDDPAWQLLDTPLGKKTFADQPIINIGQQDYPITDFSEKVVEIKGKKVNREVRFKMEKRPKHFLLTTRKGKPLKFTHTSEDGYEVFRFSGGGSRDMVVYGGASQRRMGWLAKYDL